MTYHLLDISALHLGLHKLGSNCDLVRVSAEFGLYHLDARQACHRSGSAECKIGHCVTALLCCLCSCVQSDNSSTVHPAFAARRPTRSRTQNSNSESGQTPFTVAAPVALIESDIILNKDQPYHFRFLPIILTIIDNEPIIPMHLLYDIPLHSSSALIIVARPAWISFV